VNTVVCHLCCREKQVGFMVEAATPGMWFCRDENQPMCLYIARRRLGIPHAGKNGRPGAGDLLKQDRDRLELGWK
jgi:hypothetical protein